MLLERLYALAEVALGKKQYKTGMSPQCHKRWGKYGKMINDSHYPLEHAYRCSPTLKVTSTYGKLLYKKA
jgi:hypothetical protein